MAKRISAEEFDRIFDEGNEDIVDYLDLDKAVVSYPDLDTDLRRVNVDFPEWMIDELDREAKRVGINRQAVIKTWIADRIDPYARRPLGVGEVVGRIVVDSLEARENRDGIAPRRALDVRRNAIGTTLGYGGDLLDARHSRARSGCYAGGCDRIAKSIRYIPAWRRSYAF